MSNREQPYRYALIFELGDKGKYRAIKKVDIPHCANHLTPATIAAVVKNALEATGKKQSGGRV